MSSWWVTLIGVGPWKLCPLRARNPRYQLKTMDKPISSPSWLHVRKTWGAVKRPDAWDPSWIQKIRISGDGTHAVHLVKALQVILRYSKVWKSLGNVSFISSQTNICIWLNHPSPEANLSPTARGKKCPSTQQNSPLGWHFLPPHVHTQNSMLLNTFLSLFYLKPVKCVIDRKSVV